MHGHLATLKKAKHASTEEHVALTAALADVAKACSRVDTVPMEEWSISRRASELLRDWHAPQVSKIACILMPLAKNQLVSMTYIRSKYGHKAQRIIKQLLVWRTLLSGQLVEEGEYGTVSNARLFRRLLREVYLDLPDLPFITLLLADHDARITLRTDDRLIAVSTQEVLVPVVEMLGIWSLRVRWLDWSVSVLDCDAYEEQKKRYGDLACYTRSNMKRRLRRRARKHMSEGHGEEWLNQKCAALMALEKGITKGAKPSSFSYRPRIFPTKPYPGVALYQSASESIEKHAKHLNVRVICLTKEDCYRILGIIHALGKTAGASYYERFEDFITQPRSNGYRALHTAVQVNTGAKGRTIPVNVRIMTPEMARHNDLGFLAWRYLKREFYGRHESDFPACWKAPALRTVQKRLPKAVGRVVSLRRFLTENEIGTESEPLYVFSPQGEIMLLRRGSSPIDYAYLIHSELGDHAESVIVNGEAALPFSRLTNGDIVQVIPNARSAGPDLTWLVFAKSSAAKSHILRSLMHRAKAIHVGRRMIEERMIQLMTLYDRKRKYQPLPTIASLDAFIDKTTRAQGITPRQLYERIVGNEVNANSIARRYLEQEFARVIVDMDGKALPFALEDISLCEQCLVVPGDMIIGRIQPSGRLLIHLERNDQCEGAKSARKRSDFTTLRWAVADETTEQVSYILNVGAEDRYRLLDDLLASVYKQPGARLYHVDAHANGTNASINLFVQAVPEAFPLIISQLERTDSVRRVRVIPPSPSQKPTAMATKSDENVDNPYILLDVWKRSDFFDRVTLIESLQAWLTHPKSSNLWIVHGPRRVGKTSLVKHFALDVLGAEREADSVFIDFQELSEFTVTAVARKIADKLVPLIGEQPRRASEEPSTWIRRCLQATIAKAGGRRVLLVVDEFDRLFTNDPTIPLDPHLIPNLRGIIHGMTEINWIIVLTDYRLRRSIEAGALLQIAAGTTSVPHLPDEWARALISQPAARHGVVVSSRVTDELLHLTAGNPWLLKWLCHNLFARVRLSKRATVIGYDLDQVKSLLRQEGGTVFHHFREHLSVPPARRIILKEIALASKPGQPAEVRLITHTVHSKNSLDFPVINKALVDLEALGIIEVSGAGTAASVSIAIPIFHEWVTDYLDLDDDITPDYHDDDAVVSPVNHLWGV